MNICRNLSITLVLLIAVTFPLSAFAHKEIQFFASLETPDIRLLICDGPWGRTGSVELSDAVNVHFYSAEVTTFSPYGKWSCTMCFPNMSGGLEPCASAILAKTDFHLKKEDDRVNITMIVTDTEDRIEVDLEDGNTITTTANLGDDTKRPRRDRDTFTFNFGPNPGDGAVKITLEENPETGHTGEEATLTLRSGNSNIEVNSGKLPLEITASLVANSDYKLILEQHGIHEELRFRGRYFLTVESESGSIEEIKPTFDVEQF